MTAQSKDLINTKSKQRFWPLTSRASKSPKVLVYDPAKPGEFIEEEVNEHDNVLEVKLPRWHNRVHICQDPNQRGYLFTIRLDRLGFIQNCKRRLGFNHKVLHVKGDKPG